MLTIAMDAGFQSLGPFNRAFKADTGVTPTEPPADGRKALRSLTYRGPATLIEKIG